MCVGKVDSNPGGSNSLHPLHTGYPQYPERGPYTTHVCQKMGHCNPGIQDQVFFYVFPTMLSLYLILFPSCGLLILCCVPEDLYLGIFWKPTEHFMVSS